MKTSRSHLFVAIAFLLATAGAALQAQQAPPLAPTPPQKFHHFEKVAEGVYFARQTGQFFHNGSNSIVIVNDRDVLVVDTHTIPAAARELVADIRTITDKPIRYVVNTHFHFDHTDGNQVFADDAIIIGTEFDRRQMLNNPLQMRTASSIMGNLPKQIDTMKQQLAAESDPQKKEGLQQRLSLAEASLAEAKEIVVTPPTLIVNDKMTLYRGSREIQILYLGRGHTGGDLVVYLPKERIVCTGDLLEPGVAYMGDGYTPEWIATLDQLKKLDFDTVLSGHGPMFTGKERITAFQSYLRDFWNQAEQLKKQGVPVEEAAKRIDLTSHSGDYPNIKTPGVNPLFVTRMYELMDGKDVY